MKSQFGIYPGDAGLSINHFMSLSITQLFIIIFKIFRARTAYINKNGIFFKRKNLHSLTKVLLNYLKWIANQFLNLQNSYQTFLNLNKSKMSDKLIKILK